MDNRRILIIAYKYKPETHVSVLRTSRIADFLRTSGWDPVVVTASPQKDFENQNFVISIKDPLARFRVSDASSGNSSRRKVVSTLRNAKRRVAGFARKWILFPDEQVLWSLLVISRLGRLIKLLQISRIITSSPPPSVGLIGLFASKRHRCYWLSDYRDNWTKNFAHRFPTGMHKLCAFALEKSFFNYCDRISFVQTDMLDRRKHLRKSTHIVNSYSEEDFDGSTSAAANDEKCRFLYAGSFYGIQSPIPFLKAYARFKHEFPDEFQNTIFRFAGVSHDIDILEYARDLAINSHVELVGQVSHETAIVEMMSADVLLLVIAKTAGFNTVYTGKFFEYLRAGKPILYLGQHNSVIAELLSGHEGCRICDIDDEKQIMHSIREIYLRWKNGVGCDHAGIVGQFESAQMARKFEALLT